MTEPPTPNLLAPPPSALGGWTDLVTKVTAASAVILISGYLIYFVTARVDAKMDQVILQHQEINAHEKSHDAEAKETSESIERVYNVMVAQCLNAADSVPAGARRELARRNCLGQNPGMLQGLR